MGMGVRGLRGLGFVLLVVWIASVPHSAAVGVWSSSGPNGGNVYALAVDPTNSSTVYAGCLGGGVFKSVDGGVIWACRNDGLGALGVKAIVVDPRNSSIVYAAAGEVYKSVNRGGSWTLCGTMSGAYVNCLALDPLNTLTLYAGTSSGLFKSVDGGGSWHAESGMPYPCDSLAVDPIDPSILYAGTSYGLYKSTDGGEAWTQAGSGLPMFQGISALAINPDTPWVIYAGTYWGLYKSTNGGLTWTPRTRGLGHAAIYCIALDPAVPYSVYVGTPDQGLFHSGDAGYSWARSDAGMDGDFVGAIAVGFQNGSVAYAGTAWSAGSGVFRSADSGASWSPVNTGLSAMSVCAIALAADGGAVFAGTTGDRYDLFGDSTCGAVFASEGSSWVMRSTDLVGPEISALAADPSAPAVLYAAMHNRGLFKSSDAGGHWFLLNETPEARSINQVVIDPLSTSTLYFCWGHGVMKSTDGGITWSQCNAGLDLPDALALAIDPANPSTLYAGTDGMGVYKSEDGGAHWRRLPGSPAVARSLVIDPRTTSTLYGASVYQGILKSEDGGTTWFPMNTGLPDYYVSTLAIDPLSPTSLYVGTFEHGVFRSTDAGASWRPMNEGLQHSRVRALAAEPLTGRTLYAGFTGGGVYSITVCDAFRFSPPSLPTAILGVRYSASISANGGFGPCVYQLIAGSLPPGMTMGSSGVLSGVPTGTGSYSFTVQTTDSLGCAGVQPYTLAVYHTLWADDSGRSKFYVNRLTGDYVWEILSGPGTGIYAGVAQVLNGGAKIISPQGASNALNMTYDAVRKRASGYFIAVRRYYSALIDSNTANNPGGCPARP